MEKAAITALLVVLALASLSAPANAESYEPTRVIGPFVNEIVFNITTSDDTQVSSLLNGSIDMIGDRLNSSWAENFQNREDTVFTKQYENTNGQLFINSDKYPLNLTALRRALAFAIDKQAISDDVLNESASPIDSVLPLANPFSIETSFSDCYYDSNVAKGEQLLADAGFEDTNSDGYLEAPNGTTFEIVVEVSDSSTTAMEVADYTVNALESLDINASAVHSDFMDIYLKVYQHQDYDISLFGRVFKDIDPSWIADEFYSGYRGVNFENPTDFANATFDSWRNQLVNSTSRADVSEAAAAMQEILWHECPVISVYNRHKYFAYRTDSFEGFQNDTLDGIPSYWSMMRTRLLREHGDPMNGTLRASIPTNMSSFNFMMNDADDYLVNDLLWDSLFVPDPEGDLVRLLAWDYGIETHEDDSEIAPGNMEVWFTTVTNATFTDGTNLTAEDIAFSLQFMRDGKNNPYQSGLSHLEAATAINDFILKLEFNSTSYWDFHAAATAPVIPKHVFESMDPDDWLAWNPNPATESMVTSGPFNVSEYVEGEYVRLRRVETHCRAPKEWKDSEPPTIDHPADMEFEYGSSSQTIEWTCSDANPYSYGIKKNGTITKAAPWNGSNISYNINNELPGIYEFELNLMDWRGRSSSDTVIVTVADTVAPNIPGPSDAIYEYDPTSCIWINWTATELLPDSYRFYLNGELGDSGVWDGSMLNFSATGLELGTHNFTIALNDTSGNTAYDTVFVRVQDTVDPTLSAISDISYTVGDTGNWLNWTCSDLLPDSYALWRNGEIIESGTWSSGSLNFSVDGLNDGVWIYTLQVNDTSGNMAFDMVEVSVTASTTTTNTTTTTVTETTTATTPPTSIEPIFTNPLVLLMLGAIVALVVIIMILLMKK